jgi:hypothetical protein
MSNQPVFSNGEIGVLIDALDRCDRDTLASLFSGAMGSEGTVNQPLSRNEKRQQIVLLKAKLIQMMEKVS